MSIFSWFTRQNYTNLYCNTKLYCGKCSLCHLTIGNISGFENSTMSALLAVCSLA